MNKTCPECSTGLRKYKDGVICQRNHKYPPDHKVYKAYFASIVNRKTNCPTCGELPAGISMDGGKYAVCINDHYWKM